MFPTTKNIEMNRKHYTHVIAIGVFALGLIALIVTHPWVAIPVVTLLGALTLHMLREHFTILSLRERLPAEVPPARR